MTHSHQHEHPAHEHHAHSHPHPHAAGETSHLPRWRLLSLSAGQRLLLAALPLAALWLLVHWALQEVA
ncbi:hypothetical protein PQU96_08360 [Vogesella sp. LYT5W]|uniref:Uncharacterized protein n=1 Tax=Vogesella margarita TaxID=2984199 RepID=A0ABT5INL1_9NEIS|nr:hypothetical protein [Vogesella margarita]MDC7714142.1 hypothetical protein [Vogesella margarita]